MSERAVGGEAASVSEEIRPLEAGLAQAFSEEPAWETREEEPVDPNLLQQVEAPGELDFAALEEEVQRHRRLVVRGQAGVPVTALIAIGGAILFHMLMAGVLLLGLWISVHAVTPRGGEEEGGMPGTGAGYMVSGGGGGETVTNPLKQNTQSAAANVAPQAPVLPPPPTLQPPEKTSLESVASALNPTVADPGMIGIPAGGESRVGELRVTPPLPKPPPAPPKSLPPTLVPPPSAPAAVVVPPAKASPMKTDAPSGTAVASAAGSDNGLPSWMRGPGDGGGDDGEAPISWDRSGNGGKGTGRGNGNGRGMGYLSGATRAEPTVLDAPLPQLRDIPVGMLLNPPKRNIRFKVLVRADGSVGSVEVTSSCGQPAVDEFFRGYILAHWKFQPAFVDGKFVDMSTEVTLGGLGG